MSGIVGIYHLGDRPVQRKALETMINTIAHRGPDGSNLWVNGCIGLGHCMLWSTPESLLEQLPLVNPSGHLVITADARIDNRDELMLVLDLPDRPLEKITDSEFILAAYEKWGESCPEYLLGDFAFAIWDHVKQTLFCARDHFGVKPFYYHHQPGHTFLFASEIKALVGLPFVPRRLNEVRIADYLSLMMEDKEITIYQGILRLPPAHSLVINSTGLRMASYWALDPDRELRLNSDAAYAETFRDIFTEAVRCRLRSAFPVVSHLSGGLDSSAVTCVARKLLSETTEAVPLHTISAVFDTITECDERPYINAVLDQGGMTPHYVPGDEAGPLSNLDQIFQYEDEALLGPSHFYPWIVNRAVKELGFRISLDGFDGDTTVGHGIQRLVELARCGDWSTFMQELKLTSDRFTIPQRNLIISYGLPYLKDLLKRGRWIAFLKGVQSIHRHFRASRKRLILECGFKPLIADMIQAVLGRSRRMSQPSSPSPNETSLINREFAERIGLNQRIEPLGKLANPSLTVREEGWRMLTGGLFSYTLELMDQYAAMFSLEARHPFMDKRLIEFCLSLPAEQKLYQGWGRMIMRRGLAGILPEQIQWRGGKADMSANFDDGLLKRNRNVLDQVMSCQVDRLQPYVNLSFLKSIYQRILSTNGRINDDDMMILWQAVILALWLDCKKVTP